VNIGDLILVPFPFADLEVKKVRPAVVVGFTKDKFQDAIICAITSKVPSELSEWEIFLSSKNFLQLKVDSVVKIDRITTLRNSLILQSLGKVDDPVLSAIKLKLVKFFKE
jgi:mRNA interferase MazF